MTEYRKPHARAKHDRKTARTIRQSVRKVMRVSLRDQIRQRPMSYATVACRFGDVPVMSSYL